MRPRTPDHAREAPHNVAHATGEPTGEPDADAPTLATGSSADGFGGADQGLRDDVNGLSTRSDPHAPAEVVRKDGSVGLAARGYSWEQFREGNLAAVKSGAYSDRIVSGKVEELAPGFRHWLADHAPWAADEPYAPTVLNYLRSTAVVELLLADVLDTAERQGTAKVPTRRFETALSALRSQREALRDLGLTPGTKAELASTVATTESTLHDLAARGRALNQARQAALDAQQDDTDDPEED